MPALKPLHASIAGCFAAQLSFHYVLWSSALADSLVFCENPLHTWDL